MAVGDGGVVERALRGLAPTERRGAGAEAAGLARRLEFLTWDDRAAMLDEFFWRQPRARLRHELITAVVARRAGEGAAGSPEVEGFALYCRAVLTAAFTILDEPLRIEGEAAALTFRLSLAGVERHAAEAWLDEPAAARREGVAEELARRPGYAFLLLALCPNDSAESFAARDAFFAAMHGRRAA
jgi:hypothetical protein